MDDVIDQALRTRIWDLSQDLPEQLSEAERAELARGLRDLADELSNRGDHPVEVAVIRDLARGVATGDEGRASSAWGFIDNLYRGITEGADRWYELEYVYSRERVQDHEGETRRRLAERGQSGDGEPGSGRAGLTAADGMVAVVAAAGVAALVAVAAGLVLLFGGGGGPTTTVSAVDVVIEERLSAVGTFQSGEITYTSELTTTGTITDPETGAIEGEKVGRLTIDRENGEDETEKFGPTKSEGTRIDPETGQWVCPCPEGVTRPAQPGNPDAAEQVAGVGDDADGIPRQATTEGELEIGKDPDAPEPTTDLILTGMDDRAEPRIIENSVVVETTVDEKESGGGDGPARDVAGGALIGIGALLGAGGVVFGRRRGGGEAPSPGEASAIPGQTDHSVLLRLGGGLLGAAGLLLIGIGGFTLVDGGGGGDSRDSAPVVRQATGQAKIVVERDPPPGFEFDDATGSFDATLLVDDGRILFVGEVTLTNEVRTTGGLFCVFESTSMRTIDGMVDAKTGAVTGTVERQGGLTAVGGDPACSQSGTPLQPLPPEQLEGTLDVPTGGLEARTGDDDTTVQIVAEFPPSKVEGIVDAVTGTGTRPETGEPAPGGDTPAAPAELTPVEATGTAGFVPPTPEGTPASGVVQVRIFFDDATSELVYESTSQLGTERTEDGCVVQSTSFGEERGVIDPRTGDIQQGVRGHSFESNVTQGGSACEPLNMPRTPLPDETVTGNIDLDEGTIEAVSTIERPDGTATTNLEATVDPANVDDLQALRDAALGTGPVDESADDSGGADTPAADTDDGDSDDGGSDTATGVGLVVGGLLLGGVGARTATRQRRQSPSDAGGATVDVPVGDGDGVPPPEATVAIATGIRPAVVAAEEVGPEFLHSPARDGETDRRTQLVDEQNLVVKLGDDDLHRHMKWRHTNELDSGLQEIRDDMELARQKTPGALDPAPWAEAERALRQYYERVIADLDELHESSEARSLRFLEIEDALDAVGPEPVRGVTATRVSVRAGATTEELPAITQYEGFFPIVDMPVGKGTAAATVTVTVTVTRANDDGTKDTIDSTEVTLHFVGVVDGGWRYTTHSPVTLSDPVLSDVDFTTEMSPLSFENGDTVTIESDGVSTSFRAYDVAEARDFGETVLALEDARAEYTEARERLVRLGLEAGHRAEIANVDAYVDRMIEHVHAQDAPPEEQDAAIAELEKYREEAHAVIDELHHNSAAREAAIAELDRRLGWVQQGLEASQIDDIYEARTLWARGYLNLARSDGFGNQDVLDMQRRVRDRIEDIKLGRVERHGWDLAIAVTRTAMEMHWLPGVITLVTGRDLVTGHRLTAADRAIGVLLWISTSVLTGGLGRMGPTPRIGGTIGAVRGGRAGGSGWRTPTGVRVPERVAGPRSAPARTGRGPTQEGLPTVPGRARSAPAERSVPTVTPTRTGRGGTERGVPTAPTGRSGRGGTERGVPTAPTGRSGRGGTERGVPTAPTGRSGRGGTERVAPVRAPGDTQGDAADRPFVPLEKVEAPIGAVTRSAPRAPAPHELQGIDFDDSFYPIGPPKAPMAGATPDGGGPSRMLRGSDHAPGFGGIAPTKQTGYECMLQTITDGANRHGRVDVTIDAVRDTALKTQVTVGTTTRNAYIPGRGTANAGAKPVTLATGAKSVTVVRPADVNTALGLRTLGKNLSTKGRQVMLGVITPRGVGHAIDLLAISKNGRYAMVADTARGQTYRIGTASLSKQIMATWVIQW